MLCNMQGNCPWNCLMSKYKRKLLSEQDRKVSMNELLRKEKSILYSTVEFPLNRNKKCQQSSNQSKVTLIN